MSHIKIAQNLGRMHKGTLDLDEGIPMDIYALFEQVTGRDYNHESESDELLILDIANAYENSAQL